MHGASGQPAPRPSLDGTPSRQRHAPDRDTFDSRELARVLQAYDLGTVQSIRIFPKGSRRSPKVRIQAARGEFLLKRRAPGKDDPFRVALAHQAQLHLAEHGFRVAPLVGTRGENNSMLQLGGRIYELFEFVKGVRYDSTPAQARASGQALGRMHDLLAELSPSYDPPAGSYHGDAEVPTACARLAASVARRDPAADRSALAAQAASIKAAYLQAARRVDQLGFSRWPSALLHGDWHPGNLLYRGNVVEAVLDFDSIRIEPHVIDLANGLLQFSMRTTDPLDPRAWPEGLDVPCIRAMLWAYHQARSGGLTQAECAALPWLMIETLILEAVVPIAITGEFAGLSGAAFLSMIERKARWIDAHAGDIAAVPASA